jgi:tetratricopeptide (TPR) repeat protein
VPFRCAGQEYFADGITAQLIDAHSDTHLWSAEYTREMRDIISLQREVASDIAEKIRLQLLPEQRARLAATRPVDPEAHELFLKGLHFWDMRTAESMTRAIAYFSQSVTHDPEFAPGWAYLSTSHCILHSHEASPPQLEYSKALEAAEKALRLDPMSAEAHAAMGCVRFLFEWDFRASLAELQRATELDPSYGLGHQWYSHQLVRTGMPGPAIEEIKRALAVDPVSLRVNVSYASRMMEARQYPAAIHQLLVALELYPAEVSLRRVLAQAYDHSSDPKRAGEQFGKFLAGGPTGAGLPKILSAFGISTV